MSAVLVRGWLALTCVVLLGSGCGRTQARLAQGAGAPVASDRLSVLRSGAQQPKFAQAREPRAFVFPADFGPHPEFRYEWWYWTGQLHARTGEDFGFELTFFRIALAPGAVAVGPEVSRWRTHQIYAAHFAITDVAARAFKFAQRYARGALGIAGAQATPFRVWLDDWSVAQEGSGEDAALPAWSLRAQDSGDALALHAQARQPPIPNGERGLSVKASEPGAASYYYSVPRMALAGQLVRGGRTFEVEGNAWLDREWGSGGLGTQEVGWDWFALNLSDGSALMFYALRNADGRRDPHSAGTLIGADGRARLLSSSEVGIEVLAQWRSPRGGRYPARWRVRVPSADLDLDVKPLLADQELDTRPRYWEGAVAVTDRGTGMSRNGRGYVELVGYAR